MGFTLAREVNFDKLLLNLKAKLVSWTKMKIIKVGEALDLNQIFSTSIWYIMACWNLTFKCATKLMVW
jgi:hypothetical protein